MLGARRVGRGCHARGVDVILGGLSRHRWQCSGRHSAHPIVSWVDRSGRRRSGIGNEFVGEVVSLSAKSLEQRRSGQLRFSRGMGGRLWIARLYRRSKKRAEELQTPR
jgi:hypothetical protein